MKIRFRGRERQEAQDLLVATIRLAKITLEEYERDPLATSRTHALLAGLFLYTVMRDAL
jgi:hypothetical protein